MFSRKPIFGYRAIAYSSLAIALISFFVWGHHMFTSGQSKLINIIFSAITFAVAIPTAIKVFNWLWTMHRGSVQLSAAMLYALAFIFLFTIGGLTGLYLGALAPVVHLHDTYFVVAHMHYVMIGGTLFGLFSALHFWYPKMWGKMFDEFKAKIAFVLIFIGFNVTFFPQFIMGSLGMPRRYFNYDPEFTLFHQLSTYGSWITAIGFILMVYNFFKPISDAEGNPYKSVSLEWSMSSPPPTLNFDEIPTVTDSTYVYGNKIEQEG